MKSIILLVFAIFTAVLCDNDRGWGSRVNSGYVEIVAESQGVYPDASVFNIGNVEAIFTQTPVNPAEFEVMRESALAWFEERFGLTSTSNSFPVYNAQTF